MNFKDYKKLFMSGEIEEDDFYDFLENAPDVPFKATIEVDLSSSDLLDIYNYYLGNEISIGSCSNYKELIMLFVKTHLKEKYPIDNLFDQYNLINVKFDEDSENCKQIQ